MRQYGRQNTNMLPQHGHYDYGDPLNSIWLHCILHTPGSGKAHRSMRPHRWVAQATDVEERDECTMPVHPSPLPSRQTSLQPQPPRLQAHTAACQASPSPAQ
ncbi:ameloblastin [Phoenicopterus ruber ruber]